jgi:hypothetical protein
MPARPVWPPIAEGETEPATTSSWDTMFLRRRRTSRLSHAPVSSRPPGAGEEVVEGEQTEEGYARRHGLDLRVLCIASGCATGNRGTGEGKHREGSDLFSEYSGPGGYTHAGRLGMSEKRISFLAETLSKLRFFGNS